MRIRFKLTTLCDTDLLTLASSSDFDFRGWVRETLTTYAGTGKIVKLPLPAAAPAKPSFKNQMFSITFDKKKDVAVVELLSAVQNRLRSGLIKSILRSGLSRPCLYAYFNDYPAPVQVTCPASDEPMELTAKYITPKIFQPPAHLQTPQKLLSCEVSDTFDVFDFKDEIG